MGLLHRKNDYLRLFKKKQNIIALFVLFAFVHKYDVSFFVRVEINKASFGISRTKVCSSKEALLATIFHSGEVA